jgi:hypothetical protein
MGSKRIGLARTQALIENLKRELDLGGSTLGGVVRKVLVIDSETTLSNADSGAIVECSGGAYDIKLPQSPALGCSFTFMNNAATSGERVVESYADTHFFRGHFRDHETADPAHVVFNGSSHDEIKIASGAGAGENVFTITYVGSNIWQIIESFSHDISDISTGTASSHS